MHLKDKGFKFCISPDKQEGRWLHPAELKVLHSDWTDVTEWPTEHLVAYLMPAPQQQELFAACPICARPCGTSSPAQASPRATAGQT